MTDFNKTDRRAFLSITGKAGLSALVASAAGVNFGMVQVAAAADGKGKVAPLNQPVYTLQIDTISACYEIKVNDIPLYAESEGSPTAVELPINHLLLKGLNSLQVVISPAKHEKEFVGHTKTTFEIYYRDINDLRTNRKLVTSAKFPDYLKNNELKKSVIPSKTEFQASLSLEAPAWSNSPVLELNKQTINEALGVYREYFNALKSKNIEAILKLTNIKNKVYADSLYTGLNVYINRVRESFKAEFENPLNELTDFDIQVKIPHLHAFGKLVTIMNDEGRSPLYFYDTDTGVSTEYEIYLCMKDKKLTIVL